MSKKQNKAAFPLHQPQPIWLNNTLLDETIEQTCTCIMYVVLEEIYVYEEVRVISF